jgi:peptidoglycan hydrolase CwlO-like protein
MYRHYVVHAQQCLYTVVLLLLQQAEHRSLQGDLEHVREQYEEEQENRANLQRLLQKAQNEANEWKRKAESGEGGVRSEEFDDLKKKLGARIADLEGQLEAANAKANSLEKARSRLQGEIDDIVVEMERVRA